MSEALISALPDRNKVLRWPVEVNEDHVSCLAPLKPRPVQIGRLLEGPVKVLPYGILALDELNRPHMGSEPDIGTPDVWVSPAILLNKS